MFGVFIDDRIWNFCSSLPARLSKRKNLVRKVTRKVLPTPIAERSYSQHFDPVLLPGLVGNNRQQVLNLTGEMRLGDFEFFDEVDFVEAYTALLQKAGSQHSERCSIESPFYLWQSIAAEIWLRQLTE
jgi:hypothetical protein